MGQIPEVDQSQPIGREQFRKVNTGNGIDRDLAATTNDRLEMTVIELQNLQKNNTTQMMMLTSSIDHLTDTIEDLDKKNSRLQTLGIILGVIATILSITGVIEAVDVICRWLGKCT